MKRPLCSFLRKESPYNLIDVLGHFATMQQLHFYQVKFIDASIAGKTAKILQICFELSAFN